MTTHNQLALEVAVTRLYHMYADKPIDESKIAELKRVYRVSDEEVAGVLCKVAARITEKTL